MSIHKSIYIIHTEFPISLTFIFCYKYLNFNRELWFLKPLFSSYKYNKRVCFTMKLPNFFGRISVFFLSPPTLFCLYLILYKLGFHLFSSWWMTSYQCDFKNPSFHSEMKYQFVIYYILMYIISLVNHDVLY